MLGWSHSKRNALNEMARAQFVPARLAPVCGSEQKASKGIEQRRKLRKQRGPSTEGNTASKEGPTQKATKASKGGPNTEGTKSHKAKGTQHRRQHSKQGYQAQKATAHTSHQRTKGNTASKGTQHRRQHSNTASKVTKHRRQHGLPSGEARDSFRHILRRMCSRSLQETARDGRVQNLQCLLESLAELHKGQHIPVML